MKSPAEVPAGSDSAHGRDSTRARPGRLVQLPYRREAPQRVAAAEA